MFIKSNKLDFQICILVFITLTFFGCPQYDPSIEDTFGYVTFGFEDSNANARTAESFIEVAALVATIKDDNGQVIADREVFPISVVGSSALIRLDTGDYQLTEFLLLDEENNIVYASPTEGSELEYLVTDPLAMDFTIIANETLELAVDVVDVTLSSLDQFGYDVSDFDFSLIETFDLPVTVLKFDSIAGQYIPTVADLTIKTGTNELLSKELPAALSYLKLRTDIPAYEFFVHVDGYDTLRATGTTDSLITYFSVQNPLEFRFGEAIANLIFSFTSSSPNPAINELIFPFDIQISGLNSETNQFFGKTITVDTAMNQDEVLLCEISSVSVPGGTTTTYGLSLGGLPISSLVSALFFNHSTNPSVQALYVLNTATGSIGGTPNCTDMANNVYSNLLHVNPFTYASANSTDPVLIAMCLNSMRTNYRISLASRDLAFDATSTVAGININFVEPEEFPGDTVCPPSYHQLWDSGTSFVELFKTQVGPPENPEWLVQVFELPITALCSNPSITQFNIEVSTIGLANINNFDGIPIATCDTSP